MDIPGCSKDVNKKFYYAVIRNIPHSLHSADLRSYFSFYVENEKFDCFHFRHRPEKKDNDAVNKSKKGTTCCVVRFVSQADRSQFIRDYNDKQWTDSSSLLLPSRCYADAVKVSQGTDGATGTLTEKDLKELIELRPPALMPRGNVGTPTAYFMEQIRLCRLPPSLIGKLGLKSLKKIKKFGAVPLNYSEEEKEEQDNELNEEEEELKMNPDAPDPLDPTEECLKHQPPDNDEGADDDDDQCEEWERHEALHNDVTEQDRTKERNYEPELELVWEKGGPGLVWHTDRNYWDEREIGDDCDWAWADDWDVDYSVYYEGKSAGTIDGRQAVEIREDEARWSGKLHDTAFREKHIETNKKRKRRQSESDLLKPDFHSDFGSKLMKGMGWTPGTGLGHRSQGRVEPVALQIEEDANIGKERKGVGYHGESMQRTGFIKPKVYHLIASKFDKDNDQTKTEHRRVHEDDETSEILLRSSEPTKMKYRSRLVQPEK